MMFELAYSVPHMRDNSRQKDWQDRSYSSSSYPDGEGNTVANRMEGEIMRIGNSMGGNSMVGNSMSIERERKDDSSGRHNRDSSTWRKSSRLSMSKRLLLLAGTVYAATSDTWRFECITGNWQICTMNMATDTGCSSTVATSLGVGDIATGVIWGDGNSMKAATTLQNGELHQITSTPAYVEVKLSSKVEIKCITLNDGLCAAAFTQTLDPSCPGGFELKYRDDSMAWKSAKTWLTPTDQSATKFVVTGAGVDSSGSSGASSTTGGTTSGSTSSGGVPSVNVGIPKGSVTSPQSGAVISDLSSLTVTVQWSLPIKPKAGSMGVLHELTKSGPVHKAHPLSDGLAGDNLTMNFNFVNLKQGFQYTFYIAPAQVETLASPVTENVLAVESSFSTKEAVQDAGSGADPTAGSSTDGAVTPQAAAASSSDDSGGGLVIVLIIVGSAVVLCSGCAYGVSIYVKRKEKEDEAARMQVPYGKVISPGDQMIDISDDEDDPNSSGKRKRKKKGGKKGSEDDWESMEVEGVEGETHEEKQARKRAALDKKRKEEFEKKKAKYAKRAEQQRAKDDMDAQNRRKQHFGRQRSNSFGGAGTAVPKEPELAAETGAGEEVEKITGEIVADWKKQKDEEESSKKKTLKFLKLKWHPDKNPDNQEIATKIFQFIQENESKFLEMGEKKKKEEEKKD